MALAVACLVPALAAATQSEHRGPAAISLNSKEATQLLVKKQAPNYPTLARVNYIQGRVRVEITVSDSGKVAVAHVLQGHPFLAASALSAIRHWVYRPLRIAAGAVPFKTLVDFNFTLRVTKLTRFPPTAEKDLQAQVTPPEVLDRREETPADHVRLRVLVDSDGHTIDTQPVSGPASDIEDAVESVEHWTFRPAYWGSMAVPWYTVVDVPVRHWPSSGTEADPGGL